MTILGKANETAKGIVWIASYPRSGNTWTRAFLNALATVSHDPEATAIDINRIEEGSVAEDLAELYPRFLNKPTALASPAEIAAARPWVQAALADSAGRTIYVKTHNARGFDHGAPLINMGASLGAVYIVRNPLDVAISYAHLNGMEIDTAISWMGAPGWRTPARSDRGTAKVHVVMGSWSENVASWTEPSHPAVLVIRYEDILADPVASLTRVARHLLLKAPPRLVARAVELTRFDRLRAQEDATGFSERPRRSDEAFFRSGRAGQWRDHLSEAQVARIVADHGTLMQRFGYLPEQMTGESKTARATRA